MRNVFCAPTGVAVAEEEMIAEEEMMAEEMEMMAEPISLSVGGRSHWGVAVFDDEANQNRDDLQISNDALLVFSGSTVLDTGVEVAVRIEIEGEQSGDQGDAKFADISGSFGTIRIGNEDTAGKKMATVAPYATYFYGLNDAYWSYSYSSAFEGSSQTWTDTYANAGVGASASLLYFSPVINGFQFGVSYAPEAGVEAQSATAAVSDGNDVMSVGLRYDGAFGDTGVSIAAGYATHDVPAVAAAAAVQPSPGDVGSAAVAAAPGRTVTEWAGGIVVSMAGVSLGGSMSVQDDDAGNDDLTQFDLGVLYGEGAWTVSANVGNASNDDDNLNTDFARLLANYNLGPGVNVAAALGNDSPDTGNDTTFAGIALGISF